VCARPTHGDVVHRLKRSELSGLLQLPVEICQRLNSYFPPRLRTLGVVMLALFLKSLSCLRIVLAIDILEMYQVRDVPQR
jgi:hypothetical protein